MSTVVFVGPTLAATEVESALPEARVLGPVGLGDVYVAVRGGAGVIAIIDGVFDQSLAVRHKEILWALSRGVRVLGAGSMGALRAAELAAFGMEGVGAVFGAFASGELEDDDEVAVAHAAREEGYRSLSEAMVNVRANVERARALGVVDARCGEVLLATAKALFYPDRVWSAILARARGELGAAACERMSAHVAGPERVDLKALDARLLVARLARTSEETAPLPAFRFAATESWHELMRAADARRPAGTDELGSGQDGGELLASMIESLRSRGQGYLDMIWRECAARALALELARRDGPRVDAEQSQATSDRFRRERGLITAEAMSRWMEDNRLDAATYSAFVHDEASATSKASQARALIAAQLTAVLCARGELPEIWREAVSRATARQRGGQKE